MAMSGGTAKLVATGTPSGWPGPISLYVYYKQKSQDLANNKTVLSLGMYVTTPSGWYFGPWDDFNGSYVGTATSGSNCKTFNGGCPANTQTRWLVENQDITITHESDGTKKVTVYWKWGVNSPWGHYANPSGSFSVTLTTIPRASSMDSLSCATNYFTGALTYKYTPQSSAHYNRINIALNLDGTYIAVKTINLGKKSASQQTGSVTLSSSELTTIYNEIPNGRKGALRFTLRTYSDSGYSKQIGSAGYKEVTLYIPNNSTTQPAVSMSLTPVGSLPDAFDGLYIQGKTKVKATLSATGKFEADIKSYSMKVDGMTYDSGDSYTSGYLSKYGSMTVYGYATDSREHTGSTSKNITVIAYDKPKILNVEAVRCDADGNANDNGTYLKIKAKRSYSPVVSNGVQKNFCKIRYRYKAANASSYSAWSTILAANNLNSNAIETGALLGGVFAVNHTYLVQVQAIDDVGEHAETVVSIQTAEVYMHRTKNAMGLGKYAEGENLLDVGWDAHFHGEVLIGATGMTLRDYILSVISEGG